ncbi:MAG: cupin domain-containing protein [Xenophilus sp.]
MPVPLPPIRRIVTGHDAQGRSCFVSDALMRAPHHPGGNAAHAIHDLWKSTGTPASNSDAAMAAALAGPFRLAPPEAGTVVRVIDLPPDSQRDFSRLGQVFSAYGASDALPEAPRRHPAFHRTRSLDYALVLDGEVWALMDEGETLMRAGDMLVQRGTSHAWSNRSDRHCRLLFVLIDAQPIAGQDAGHASGTISAGAGA